MKNAIITILVLALLAAGAYFLFGEKETRDDVIPPPGQNQNQNQDEEMTVKLFYYDPEKDEDASGNILCSSQGLVEVERQIPRTMTPLQDSIKLLLEGQLTAAERARGVTTEFPLPGVELESANIEDGVATLEFKDPNNRTGGGACRAGVLWAQIEATAKQFPTVDSVKFIPEELFQP